MKSGPERELAERYIDRFARAGPALGLEWAGLREVPESRARAAADRRREEAQRLLEALPDGAALLLLDERGRDLSSEALAAWIGARRDEGQRDLVLAIGGPDGHDGALRARAALVLCFGSLTWPHQLVRIMAAEQLYRAASILAGHPYHRA